VPFSLGIMVQNIGGGEAKNFSIASAQPKIIDNEKGLLIDFNIMATEVGGQSLTPSLTANFGTIQPGETKVGRWLMRSSLQGFFVDYRAWFEHEEQFGGRAACLIDSVTMHEMIHVVKAGGVFEDGLFDFLVNDDNDTQHLPDTLYLSNGTTNPVVAVLSATTSAAPTTNALAVQLTAAMPAGWAYLRVPDPGNGQFRLARVIRSDGLEISVGTNAWTTDRTFVGVGQRPVNENRLHLLDYNSPGTYTLYYETIPAADQVPPQSSVAALPTNSTQQIPLQWNGSDAGGSGIAWYDVYVSANGSQFVPWLQKTHLNGAIFQGVMGVRYAFYSVATDNAGNQEAPHSIPDAETLVSLTNSPPILAAIADQTINEGDTLNLTVSATDADGPASALLFSLDPGAPAGASMNPTTGQLIWPTTEAHGPSTNQITVRVTDSGSPRLSDTRTFSVIIREVNSPPMLPAQPNRTVYLGQTLSLDLMASDPDIPANHLAYALMSGPNGMTLNPSSGGLAWTPSLAQWPSTNVVTVTVTDDGSPPLSATNSFLVTVSSANHPPTLAAVPDWVIEVGKTLIITNLAGDPDGSSQSLVFGFGSQVPAGATIDPTNGIFSWTPQCYQGSTTNLVTITVTDNGVPPMSAAVTFSVTVQECIEPSLGTLILPAGERGRLPIWIFSTAKLTNLTSLLALPDNQFADPALDVVAPQICTNFFGLVSNSVYSVSLGTCPNQWLQGTQQLAWLYFTSLSNQPSAFSCLRLTNTVGIESDGSPTAQISALPGKVVIVGEEPLLEALLATNGQRSLILYGKPGSNYVIEARTNLSKGNTWQPVVENISLTNLFQVLPLPADTNQSIFFRAARVVASNQPWLRASFSGNGQISLVVYGKVGPAYTLEATTNLAGHPTWQPLIQHITLTNLSQVVNLPTSNAPSTFYRARTE